MPEPSDHEAVLATDENGTIRVWSPAAELLLGWSRAEAIGASASTCLSTIPREPTTTLSAVTKQGISVSVRCETWEQRIGAEELRFHALTKAVDPAASHADSDLLNRILDHLPIGVWIADRAGSPIICNPQGRYLLTLIREQSAGSRRAWWSRSRRELGASDWPVDKAIATGESTHLAEVSFAPAEGGAVTLQLSAVPFRDEHGEIIGAIAVASDISRKKELEESLQQSNDRLEAVLASISSILIGMDANERIILWNATATRTFGATAAVAMGQDAATALGRLAWDQIAARVRHSEVAIRVDDVGHRDSEGRERLLAFVVTPMRDGGKPTGRLLCGADITDRRHAENRQWQSQKLQSIGELAAGVAHEINTPLQFITDNTRFIQDFLGDLLGLIAHYRPLVVSAADAPALSEIRTLEAKTDLDFVTVEGPRAIIQTLEGIEHVSSIVQALRELSHPGDEIADMDINRAISSSVALSRNEWKYVADLRTDLDEGLPPVFGLRGGINQALLNIIVNAAQAIGDRRDGARGSIVVSTRLIGEAVEVRISDDGPGIPEHIRSRIYDPFFTTKPVGKGTGQGLAIAHAVIVEKCRGTLRCESEYGKGTTFIIHLPIARPAGGRTASGDPPPGPSPGSDAAEPAPAGVRPTRQDPRCG